MVHQVALTVLAKIKPGAMDDLKAVLKIVGDNVESNELIPFARLHQVHFARFVILEEATDARGQVIHPSLVLVSNIDAPLEDYLTQLVELASAGLDRIYSHCEGYPAANQRNQSSRLHYLQTHMIPSQAFYVNTIGRPAQQVRQEAQLREDIEGFLDRQQAARAWSGWDAKRIRTTIQDFVKGEPSLSWATAPAAQLDFWWRVKEKLRFILILLALLVLSPLLIPLLPCWLLMLRYHEKKDARAGGLRLSFQPRGELAIREDKVVQNQFSAVGNIKPGWFRYLTVRVLLWAADFVSRHVFNKGDLGTVKILNLNGVDTIHFAQWIVIDEGRRVLFMSNYDGSLTSYMDDFINKVAWGLNAVFSNGEYYPKTRWLVLDGARDEQGFKAFLQKHQIATQAWYTAYKQVTAVNIANNAQVRAGLYKNLDEAETAQWLRRI